MRRVLIVTIDGERYRVEGDRDADAALADFQRLMRDDALGELILAGGRRMIVNWGRVTAMSVGEARDEELSYSGQQPEPRWPQRPF